MSPGAGAPFYGDASKASATVRRRDDVKSRQWGSEVGV